MSQIIVRVHPVHLMNVGQRQADADPQTKPTNLGSESACRLLSSTSTIVIYTDRHVIAHIVLHSIASHKNI